MTEAKKETAATRLAPKETTVEEPATSKADLKRSAMADELEALKAAGDTDGDRFAELKKLLADA